ncbi:MAG: hypothetical protein WCX63_04540 [Methanoregula sp.]
MEDAEQYFGLAEDFEKLFSRPVDLVETGPIRNPYFLKSLEETKIELYAAAGYTKKSFCYCFRDLIYQFVAGCTTSLSPSSPHLAFFFGDLLRDLS